MRKILLFGLKSVRQKLFHFMILPKAESTGEFNTEVKACHDDSQVAEYICRLEMKNFEEHFFLS